EKANEKAMLEDGGPLGADVFLAGHHGSSTSNTEAFVGQVSPGLVVVSCAAGNSYGHPHKSALSAFEAANARVLRTDKDGSVVVRPAETGLAVGTEKELREAA
ncbi:MBL fold metallo-hydrolase, partial [Ruminococcaceae bacterium OttesenSCG-928-D13]|nr:MBL fold metallo-hydrolase [Ruminococcaceae bacterium OttesenSCG-928-D13]